MRNSTFVPDAPHRLRPLERLRLRSLIVFPIVPQAGLHTYILFLVVSPLAANELPKNLVYLSGPDHY